MCSPKRVPNLKTQNAQNSAIEPTAPPSQQPQVSIGDGPEPKVSSTSRSDSPTTDPHNCCDLYISIIKIKRKGGYINWVAVDGAAVWKNDNGYMDRFVECVLSYKSQKYVK
jgi:hypothetical protein